MTISFPAESAQYRMARNRLLRLEIERRRATEAVALPCASFRQAA